jgi:uncharacterized membrane protein HdeD (DUF308 family)
MHDSGWLIIRGVLSLVIGILAFLWPGVTLLLLIALFATYALLDGIVNLVLGFRRTPAHDRSWAQVGLGIISIGAAVVAVTMPRLTLFWLVMFIAAWAIVRGVLDLLAAVRLRREIEGEWLLALSGVISIVFGIVVFAFPSAGALTIAWLMGMYAAAWGVVLIGLGIRLRRPIVA